MAPKISGDAEFPFIDSSKSEIRLLELLPGSQGSPIHSKFHVTSLDAHTLPYEAVSYAWASNSANGILAHTIFIDGSEITVTANLFNALERLRLLDEARRLWVDAVCINQADDSEKSLQVKLMNRIYTQCDQCAIWLGQLGDVRLADAQAALDTVALLAGTLAKQPPAFRDSGENRANAAAALKTMINLPWWHRIWTVQEAMLPHVATLYWGPCRLSWELMYRASDNIMNNSVMHDYPGEFWGNGTLTDLTCSMRGMQLARDEEPLRLLHRWRYRDATDPRDKVYGLMAIRDDISLPSGKDCNYQIDVAELFCRVTVDLINESGSLEPLIGRRGEINAIHGLPSWAMDWSRRPDDSPYHGDFWQHQDRWNCRDYTPDRGLFGVGEGLRVEGGRILILSGLFVDKVAVVEKRDSEKSGDGGGLNLLLSLSEKWGSLITEFQKTLFGSRLNDSGAWMKAFLGLITGKLIPGEPDDCDQIDDWAHHMVRDQSVFITETGHFGLGPQSVKPGQELWVIGGSQFPFILKPWGNGRTRENATDYELVGDCVVYGIMKGEAVENSDQQPVDIRLH